MTPNKQHINGGTRRQFTVRWSEDFWEAASIEATKRRSSLQDIVTDAVAEYLRIDYPSGASRSESTSPAGGKKKSA